MSRNGLDLVLVAVIFLALLLAAPDILLCGSGFAWWVAQRSDRLESGQVARAAMFGGVAVRLALLVAALTWSSQLEGSTFFDFLDAMLLSPKLTAFSLLVVGMLTLIEAFALGYAVRVIVTRLPL